jgi:PKHD-type hydroxylase
LPCALRGSRDGASQRLSFASLFSLPRCQTRIFPPLFNRYGGDTNYFGNHVDNAMRPLPDGSVYVHTYLSATLFLAEPEDYDGGELVIEDTYGTQSVKLKAGSMVRNTAQRRLLYEMDMALLQLRQRHGDSDPVIRLTGTYHNLLRRWAEV